MAATPTFSTVGQPIPRVEGPEKVSGRAQYSADILPPGTLWAKNVRSPHPHARIVSINTARALAVPGVRAILTARDIPAKRVGRPLADLPVLCGDRVRFVGDKVAVVAAEDADAAEEAAYLLDVEYQELPAVFDPLAALEAGAPIIHPDARSYVGFPKDIPADIPNACAYQVFDRGDVAEGFAAADIVVEHTFRTQLSHQGYLEPAACVVQLVGDRIEVWASQKVPYSVRTDLAEATGRPESDILVHPIKIGADFGSKGGPAFPVTSYYLARATGRPVKLVNSQHDDLIAASLRHPSVVTIRSGVKRDGTITAREGKVIFNTGAYGAYKPSPNGMLGGAGRMASCYTIPNLHVEAYCTYTNQVPCGYMRAPGSPQVIFAVEAHTDLIARELGMDPVELRERNLPAKNHDGAEDAGRRVLRAAVQALWNPLSPTLPRQGGGSQTARLVGRGVGICNRGTGTGEGSSDITVNPDG
ncbi:MAG TPA: molybdopterin cofactor-binding domain-containing protein, partial [Chloroflexota bacterium]